MINMPMYKRKWLVIYFRSWKKRYSKATAIRILELGRGTGYITEKLVHLFPNAQITAIDFAESMIAVAKQRRHVDEVTFRCEDIEKLILDDFYDVIISNATFQWLNDLQVSLVKLYKHLAGEGILLFSTFGNRTFQELHRAFERAKEEKKYKKSCINWTASFLQKRSCKIYVP